jgi:hypothetical protein
MPEGALHPHCERPEDEEDVGDDDRGLAVARQPDGQEASLRCHGVVLSKKAQIKANRFSLRDRLLHQRG